MSKPEETRFWSVVERGQARAIDAADHLSPAALFMFGTAIALLGYHNIAILPDMMAAYIWGLRGARRRWEIANAR